MMMLLNTIDTRLNLQIMELWSNLLNPAHPKFFEINCMKSANCSTQIHNKQNWPLMELTLLIKTRSLKLHFVVTKNLSKKISMIRIKYFGNFEFERCRFSDSYLTQYIKTFSFTIKRATRRLRTTNQQTISSHLPSIIKRTSSLGTPNRPTIAKHLWNKA